MRVVGRTRAIALLGLSGAIVEVEADISAQLPKIVLIGLPDTALQQATHRVRAAAANAGIPLSPMAITVNLSPASLPKHGSGFDLAIALACLAAAGDVAAASIERVVHIGELALDGRLRPVAGVLPAVIAARRAGCDTVMVPSANVAEAALVPGIRVLGMPGLRDAAIWHGGDFEPIPIEPILPTAATAPPVGAAHEPDIADIVGQDAAVFALQVAAAGGHHAFLLGPPGAGKTMLADRLPGLLPDLDEHAALEVSSIRSLSGLGVGGALSSRPPIESPHHTATAAAMVGGGSAVIRPGAAVRAAHGVLFLDEAPEFQTAVLDALRQPLESGVISIHRANAVAHFPARFQLLLAANPCPCGQFGVEGGDCTCPPNTRRRYLARLSGPLLDRIDIQLRVHRVTSTHLALADQRAGEPGGAVLNTAAARAVVEQARASAAARLDATPWALNNEVPGEWLRARARRPGAHAMAALDRALERGGVTMRGYDRVLRVAWSIADIEGAPVPGAEHIAQALYLRRGI